MDYFKNIWTPERKAQGLELFHKTYEHLLEFHPMIFYGTLLGACRQGGLIPWDGDFDLVVSLKHYNDITFVEGYRAYTDHDFCFKIFSKAGRKTAAKFRWPWVDIEFYDIDQGQIKFLTNVGDVFYKCPTDEVFPYETILFEDFPVLCPKSPTLHLDRLYPGWRTKRVSPIVNHRKALPHDRTIEEQL